MKATDYIPIIYENNFEMNSLVKSDEIELEELKTSIQNGFKDNFITQATEKGVENFEKIFNITPDPTKSLELRKEILLNRMTSQAPFTEEFLIKKLNEIIGEGNWNYDINYSSYELDVFITMPGRTWLKELNDLFSKIIPCNIDWTINIYAANWGTVKDYFTTWNDVNETCSTWQDVMDALWLNN